MRQFVYETEDDENSESCLKKPQECIDTKIVYRKQKPLKILNDLTKVRVVNNKLKKTSIQHIIRYQVEMAYFCAIVVIFYLCSDSESQRLMLGDSSMIPVPGSKGPLKPQGTINSMKQLRTSLFSE